MPDFLTVVFFNNTVRQWLIAAAFIIGGFFAGKLFSRIMRIILGAVFSKKKNSARNLVMRAVERPVAFLVFLLGMVIGLRGLELNEAVRLWIERVFYSFLVAIVTWALTRALDAIIVRFIPHGGKDSHARNEARLQPLVRKLMNSVLWLIAIALILRTMGYNVSALMAGLGLGGAALALASKDTLSNFFGSITVFVDRPFRINDRIKIGSYDGVITEMGIRTSRLRTMENRTVFIPNSLFAAQPIENVSVQPNIKVVQTIGIKSDNGSEKIHRGLEIIREIASADPGLEGKASAGLVSVSGGGCQANFTYYVSKRADYNDTLNRINMEILRRFEEEGIRLA